MNDTDSLSPVTIASYFSVAEAQLARTTLEGSGIESWIVGETVGVHDWRMVMGQGGLRLQVRAAQVEEAGEILGLSDEVAGEPGTFDGAAELAAADEEVRCPRCGSVRIEESSVAQRESGCSRLFWPLAAFWFLVGVLTGRRVTCLDCGNRWRPGREPG